MECFNGQSLKTLLLFLCLGIFVFLILADRALLSYSPGLSKIGFVDPVDIRFVMLVYITGMQSFVSVSYFLKPSSCMITLQTANSQQSTR